MAEYRFARTPKWIAGHVLVAVLLIVFVSLGFWQLRRLEQRRDTNVLIESRSTLAPAPLGDLVDPGDAGATVDGLRFLSVAADGTYRSGDEASVAVRSSQGGRSGAWVFTILDLDDGEAVAVLRGFVSPAEDGSVSAPRAPTGEVAVLGVAVPRSRLELVARQAVDDLADDGQGLLPVIVQATDVDGDDASLVPVPLPALGEGSHFSYAVQWFAFAMVGVVGYPLLLRRRAQERAPAP